MSIYMIVKGIVETKCAERNNVVGQKKKVVAKLIL